MQDIETLKNNELESVAGGNGIESYESFSVGDWVTYKTDEKTRRSPESGSGLSRPYYRIREFNTISSFVVVGLDRYDLSPLGVYEKMTSDNCSIDEIKHFHAPLGFDE